MLVTVNGSKVEVGVSEGGVFFDVATKNITATTLKALTKKLQEAAIPKGGIAVQNRSGKKGTVTGRVKSKGWRRRYFTVNWEDGTHSDDGGYELVRAATPEETAKMEELEKEITNLETRAQAINNPLTAARQKLKLAESKLSMQSALDLAFPQE